MAVTVLKNTNQEAVVKVSGAGTGTINLTTDLTNAQQSVSGTPTVNIVTANWVGAPNSTIVISRGATVIMSIPADAPQLLDFTGQGYCDTIANTSNISVVVTGEAAIYLTLRKVAGWIPFAESAVYGAYDDPTRVGASTAVSGSPDKV